jgi:hypothetical protein
MYMDAKKHPSLSKRIHMWMHNESEAQKSEEEQQEISREQEKN